MTTDICTDLTYKFFNLQCRK